MTLRDRLSEAMAGPPKVTSAALARACGVKPPSVSDWLSGKTKTLSAENLLAAAKFLGVNADWLSSGRGPMHPSGRHIEDVRGSYVSDHATRAGYIRFPLLEGFAGMGRGDYVGDYPEIVDFIEVTKEWAAQALRGVPLGKIRVITGRGDSMRGQYNDGDLIFVDGRVKQFIGDSAYCYRWNGQVQIKRLQLVGRNVVRILSANPAYQPLEVPLEEIEIGGRALASWSLIEF